MSKTCPDCEQTLPLTSFYKAGKYWTKRCKKCHNLKRRAVKKPTGFAKLAPETQQKIRRCMLSRDRTKDIAKSAGVPYSSLRRWIKGGQITPRPEPWNEIHKMILAR